MILSSLMFCTGQGWAASWQQAASARASTEYDTNPAMDSAYRGSGIWQSSLVPSYTVTGTASASEFNAGLALHVARSSNKILSQDREDPSVFLNWRRQGEKGELGISTRYDEVSTRVAELTGTGLIFADGTRASRTMSASGNRALGERSTLSVDGAYTDTSYKGGTFVDFVTHSGGVSFNYAWSERSIPFIKVSYLDFAPAGSAPTNRRYNAMLGLNWKVSDQLDWIMQAGQSRNDGVGGSDSSQGGVVLQYTGQLTRLALNADRQVVPSGLGGFITADQVKGSWSYDMSEHGKIGVYLGWRKNQSLTDNFNRTAGTWLQRELNSLWGMRMYYQHKISGSNGANNASSNILGFSLAYTNPNF